jgi:4-amino-4-deoxy-L-arabinose transferase-like glycosyltransferase
MTTLEAPTPSRSAEASRVAGLTTWRYVDASILGLIVVSITAVNLVWTARDSHRLYWDFARHLGDSLVYKDAFPLLHPLRFIEVYVRYPPLTYVVTDVFYSVFGTAIWVAVLSNGVFLSILVFSTYGIGKTLWSRRVGLLSALLVVTSPLFVGQLKWYMLDAPLSAMVALALYYLIRSDSFADRGSSLILGVACGLGILTKWSFPFFLLLPVIVAVVAGAARARRERSSTSLLNMGAAGLVALALTAVWYVPNYSAFRNDIDVTTSVPRGWLDLPPVNSLSSALWYFWDLVNNQLYLIPFLFLLAGIGFLFFKDESADKNAPLLLSVVGSYIYLSLLVVKDFRYAMPMMPALAVLATHWLDYLKPAARRWLTGGLVAYSIATFIVISFGTGLLPNTIKIPLATRSYTSDLVTRALPEPLRVTGIVVFDQHSYFVGAPSHDQWHQEDAFKEMAALGTGGFAYSGPPTTSGCVELPACDQIWFQTWGLRYYGLRYHRAYTAPEVARFLITRGPQPPGVTRGFVLIKKWPLRYTSPLSLYERQ